MKKKWIKKVGIIIFSVIAIVGLITNLPVTNMKAYASPKPTGVKDSIFLQMYCYNREFLLDNFCQGFLHHIKA